jgi:hypothetical protein
VGDGGALHVEDVGAEGGEDVLAEALLSTKAWPETPSPPTRNSGSRPRQLSWAAQRRRRSVPASPRAASIMPASASNQNRSSPSGFSALRTFTGCGNIMP